MDADEIARRNAARIMEKQGVSQAELVRRAQANGHTFDTATCNRVLRGHQPIRGHLEKFAAGLDVSMSTLLDEDEGGAVFDSDDTAPVPQSAPPVGFDERDDTAPVPHSAPPMGVE